MHIPPSEIDGMSLWQFGAAVERFNRANSPEADSAALSDGEVDDLYNWLKETG